jgi:hypothetical protein
MSERNIQVLLAARPKGFPKASDFKIVESEVPKPGEREILVRTLYLSVDPYMRGRMSAEKSYARNVELGEVMTGDIVGEVIESHHPDFKAGDIVQERLGWQSFAVTDGSKTRKVDTELAPISTALGVLGMPGLTAYFGLLEVSPPAADETVVVSAASGAVGSVVGQIAKIKGCRAVGIAGTEEKIRYVSEELTFDGAFNYKTTEDYGSALQELCPDGIDVYFDNVGGPILDAVIPQMNVYGRISICGQISQYNATEPPIGPRPFWNFIKKRLKAQGFLVFDFEKQFDKAFEQLGIWVREGRIKYREDIIEGLENAPEALIGMFHGDNIGKRLVKVAEGELRQRSKALD